MSDPTHVANEYQGQYAGGLDNSQWEVISFEAKTFFSRCYPSFLSIYPINLSINLCIGYFSFIKVSRGRVTYKSLISTRKLMLDSPIYKYLPC